jgi:hypothetical protein
MHYKNVATVVRSVSSSALACPYRNLNCRRGSESLGVRNPTLCDEAAKDGAPGLVCLEKLKITLALFAG